MMSVYGVAVYRPYDQKRRTKDTRKQCSVWSSGNTDPIATDGGDLAEVMVACADARLDSVHVGHTSRACATVIAAAGGYLESYTKGEKITIEQNHRSDSHGLIFHAGTSTSDGSLRTSGGRVP